MARPFLHLVSTPSAVDDVDAVSTEWLADVVAGLAEARDLWEPRVRHDPNRRFFERLLDAETYDAWLIGWSPGHAIPAHDHGTSTGAVVVTDGQLVETQWRARVGSRSRVLSATDAPVVVEAGEVHALANLHAVPATSIHVYSPKLESMRWFEPGADQLRVSSAETVTHRRSHTRSVEAVLGEARGRLRRLLPAEARLAALDGALLVDIRPEVFRRAEGAIPGAVVVERNVLEWRLDPTSPDRLPGIVDHDARIVLVCNEGYASSLAAAALHDLGLTNATDVDGGYRAWQRAGLPVEAPEEVLAR